MAFPVDADRVTGGGNAQSFNVPLPASIVSGDILILIVSINGTAFSVEPAGFTLLAENAQTNPVSRVYWRAADGTEGSTVNVQGGVTTKWASVCWKVTGGDTATTPAISTVNVTNNGVPDPTSVSPSGGAKDYLWIWVAGCNRQPTMPPTGNPTNYSNTVGVQSGGTGGAASKECAFGASRQNNAASEDAGSWTLSDTAAVTQAWVVAVYPTTAAPGPTPGTIKHRRADRFLTAR